MASVLGFVKRNYWALYPPAPPKDANALKFGILGAAKIAPNALITPARSHPGVIVQGVAARNINKARIFAKKHGIPQVYSSYQDLLDDPFIDVVYNPLPNGLHYEWTIKCLNAGKHVLLEKPAGNTAEEVVQMFQLAKEKKLVLLEAFHYRFHPAIQKFKALVDSGTIGKLKGSETELGVPSIFFAKDDIRFKYSLGGGATMDMGAYTVNLSRYILGEPTDVIHIAVNPVSKTDPDGTKVDRSMRAVLELPNDVTAAIYQDLGMPNQLGFLPRMPRMSMLVDGEEGSVYIENFIAPSLYHTIIVKKRNRTQTYKVYTFEDPKVSKGEDWWSTYRYQLEAFVDEVQGRKPQTWVTPEDSIANAKVIDDLYEKSGLGKRPLSSYYN